MMRLYGDYLEEHFRRTAETPCWILLVALRSRSTDQHQPGAYLAAEGAPHGCSRCSLSSPTGLMDARRFFSQVVVAPRGTTVYVAGQTGFRADWSIAPTKEGQMVQAFENVKIAPEAAKARMDQVVSMTVYIVGYSEADLEPLARLTAEYFPPDRRPASTLVPCRGWRATSSCSRSP